MIHMMNILYSLGMLQNCLIHVNLSRVRLFWVTLNPRIIFSPRQNLITCHAKHTAMVPSQRIPSFQSDLHSRMSHVMSNHLIIYRASSMGKEREKKCMYTTSWEYSLLPIRCVDSSLSISTSARLISCVKLDLPFLKLRWAYSARELKKKSFRLFWFIDAGKVMFY